MKRDVFLIGEFAAHAAVTVRYYGQVGLLAAAVVTESGQRPYTATTKADAKFVLAFQAKIINNILTDLSSRKRDHPLSCNNSTQACAVGTLAGFSWASDEVQTGTARRALEELFTTESIT